MASNQLEISSCEVCGATDLPVVLSLGMHPLCDDLIPVGDARRCEQFPIDVLFCPHCRTAHQRVQISKELLFPASYHYRARFTKDVVDGMAELVASFETRFGSLKDKTILDIGCNDGSLLSAFRARGARTAGIEPTSAAEDAIIAGHDVLKAYFDDGSVRVMKDRLGRIDAITFTNVFAHISDLQGLLTNLKRIMSEGTIIVVENHYLGAVLDGNQFDTFYHEHPRTYGYTSFQTIAGALGLEILHVEFPARYGGNIRVFMGTADSKAKLEPADVDETDMQERFGAMSRAIEHWRGAKRHELRTLVSQYGPLPAKAFPGRAAILFRLLDLDETMIEAVYEKAGSKKIGHYVPGSRVPIISEEKLFASSDLMRPIVNLAWHIPAEITGYLRELHYQGPIVHIAEAADFHPNA